MKYAPIILILLIFTACKKEKSEPFVPVGPQKVTYTVRSQSATPKHITGELWSVKKGAAEKSVLVAKIDTTTSETYFYITLTQNVHPVIYCVANLTVDGYDNFSLTISSGAEAIHKGGTCAANRYEIQDTYLTIYSN